MLNSLCINQPCHAYTLYTFLGYIFRALRGEKEKGTSIKRSAIEPSECMHYANVDENTILGHFNIPCF